MDHKDTTVNSVQLCSLQFSSVSLHERRLNHLPSGSDILHTVKWQRMYSFCSAHCASAVTHIKGSVVRDMPREVPHLALSAEVLCMHLYLDVY